MIALLVAAGLAVGLALPGLLSNFAAGVLLVIFRPLRVGEYVDLGGVAGTGDNKITVVPNGKVIAGNIINYSREPNRRVDIVVGVGYHADIDLVKKVLGDVIAADKRISACQGRDCASELNGTILAELYHPFMDYHRRVLERVLRSDGKFQARAGCQQHQLYLNADAKVE